ncbi:MAG: proline--tRNA ligase, partial [Clostridiales bacterium]|nr:proline--tRNA ligase [Clostridiales bacterium]
EGHTAHATEDEAQEETLKMLEVYREFAYNVLAMPVVTGQKTEKEKFAGALHTYTIEALMQDGRALQAGTSHNLAQHFAKVFDIQFLDRDSQLKYVWQTSWGVSTRLIGGLIMVHGDERGLVLPPKVAPTQVVIVPIAMHKGGVLEKANELYDRLKDIGIRVELDDRETQSPGWKFNEWELKGVPVRLEIGPRDIKNNQVVLARRDNGEKEFIKIENLEKDVMGTIDAIQSDLLQKALDMREDRTTVATSMDEFKEGVKRGFVKAMWCGSGECEDAIREESGATARCMPFEQEDISEKCICCSDKAEHMVYFSRAY